VHRICDHSAIPQGSSETGRTGAADHSTLGGLHGTRNTRTSGLKPPSSSGGAGSNPAPGTHLPGLPGQIDWFDRMNICATPTRHSPYDSEPIPCCSPNGSATPQSPSRSIATRTSYPASTDAPPTSSQPDGGRAVRRGCTDSSATLRRGVVGPQSWSRQHFRTRNPEPDDVGA
jgi:hypothetical protein